MPTERILALQGASHKEREPSLRRVEFRVSTERVPSLYGKNLDLLQNDSRVFTGRAPGLDRMGCESPQGQGVSYKEFPRSTTIVSTVCRKRVPRTSNEKERASHLCSKKAFLEHLQRHYDSERKISQREGQL